nr:hypothetical protein [uncultured Desulfobacter sp.]
MGKAKKVVSIWLAPEIIKKIDHFADQARINRSQIVHNLIEVGYEEMRLLKNLHLVKFSVHLWNFKKAITPLIKSENTPSIIVGCEEPKKDSISLRIDPDLLQKLDDMAHKLKMTRKGIIEHIIDFEFREIKMINSVPGVLSATVFLRDTLDTVSRTWKKSFEESKKEWEIRNQSIKK